MVTLFQFQEDAAAEVSSKISDYLDSPVLTTVDKKIYRVPFFQALSALTGAGKTVILAEAVAQVAAVMPVKPIILWLSKGKVVVRQTFVNLSEGGKYHHLLDSMAVDALANYKPDTVAEVDQPLVFFATVGTFNQREKESGTLLIHKSDVDNMEASVWQALGLRLDAYGNRRPLVIVYDEAQNLSDQQTSLLMELQPDGFLLASATMRLPARLGLEIQRIKDAGYSDADLITRVKTPEVVDSALVKDTVLVEGYNTPMEEAVSKLLEDWKQASVEAADLNLDFRPKCIYVCNTNVVADTPSTTDTAKQPFNQRQAPPILIWRYLVEQQNVEPSTIAVYSDLRVDKGFPLPDDFTLFRGGDKDFDSFTQGDFRHVIFNLTLQEGWDDPSVYFAYIDKSMASPVQVTQIIGRVLRQPGAEHYALERLNAAHFYIRVDRHEVFNDVIRDIQRELGEEAGGIRILATAPGKTKPAEYLPKSPRYAPETGLDPTVARALIEKLMLQFPDFRGGGVNVEGKGSRRILRQPVGKTAFEGEWEEYEESSRASARWIFHRAVQRQFKSALGVVNLADPKLDAIVGIGSPAEHQTRSLADLIVEAYVKGVRLVQRRVNPFVVGSVLSRPEDVVNFKNAVHTGYSGLNTLEQAFAEVVDDTAAVWARNPPRSGYGIPLISIGPTTKFYPDFLIWTAERVVCVDTKGPHLVQETARRKLLRIRPPSTGPRLDVQFVSAGAYDDKLVQKSGVGYTCLSLGDDGSIQAHAFNDMKDLVAYLLADENHQM